MARIRSIKPEFWTSEQVLECSTNARLLFIGLWNFCDDHGRHTFAPKQIKALIFSADDFTTAHIEAMLGELITQGLIRRYAVADKQYLEVTGWHHQKIDKRQPPKFPAPSPNDSGVVVDHSSNVRRMVSTEGNTEPEGSSERKESPLRSVELMSIEQDKVEDGAVSPNASLKPEDAPRAPKVPAKPPSAAHAAIEKLGLEFYQAYPKKEGRQRAANAFVNAVKEGADPEFIVAKTRDYAAAFALSGKDKQFVPMPATWLNDKRWLDEDLPAPAVSTYRGPSGHKPFAIEDVAHRARAAEIMSDPKTQEWRQRHGLSFGGMKS
jgi:hypothetical protein